MTFCAIIMAGMLGRIMAPVSLAAICLGAAFSVALVFILCGLRQRWAWYGSLLLAAIDFTAIWCFHWDHGINVSIWLSVIGGLFSVMFLVTKGFYFVVRQVWNNGEKRYR